MLECGLYLLNLSASRAMLEHGHRLDHLHAQIVIQALIPNRLVQLRVTFVQLDHRHLLDLHLVLVAMPVHGLHQEDCVLFAPQEHGRPH